MSEALYVAEIKVLGWTLLHTDKPLQDLAARQCVGKKCVALEENHVRDIPPNPISFSTKA